MAIIYLSSTYEDLKDYRSAVFEALRKAGYDVLAMEDYVATDKRPLNKCLADVGRADIYIGLFAFRYGYVPPREHGNPDGLSITELELRHAEKLQKSCLAFAVSEDAPWPPKFIDGLKGERINQLREYLLTEKMASFFSTPHQLASLVQAAVTKQLEENKKLNKPSIKEPAPSRRIVWDIEKNGSPYPGLMHFTRKYAPVFFGREVEVRDILDRMRLPEGRFIIVSGDSGIGKSSVIDAGILPRLEGNGLPDNQSCVCIRMVPSQKDRPFASMMTALGTFATTAGLRPDAIVEELERAPQTLANYIKKITKDGTDRTTLVLFLDQMEELFAARDPEESNKFLTGLYQAVQEQALWVLATIRSDRLHYCHRHREMLQVLRGLGDYPLGRVEPYMMSDMIVKPALCAGLTIPDTLVRRLLNDTGLEAANLPLLAFVLDQLFQKRSDHKLSDEVYRRLGGVSGAIAEHVKTVENKICHEIGSKALDLLPKIFHSLAIIKEEEKPTRNRPLLAEFPTELHPLVHVLVRERLLNTEGEGESASVSVTHEKLFEAWPALRNYISVNKKALMDQTLLESRARKWEQMGKPRFSGLASGRELKDFRRSGVPTKVTREYLSASQRTKWLRNGASVILAVILLVILFVWREGLSVEYTLLKLSSSFKPIHLEPAETDMIEIKEGSFSMGDIPRLGEDDEQPVHQVQIQRTFKMSRYEVTFVEYDRFALATGRRLPGDLGFGRGYQPVIDISWEDATAYALWLSKQTGKHYRLPSESEWEYAARSGGKEEIWSGTSHEQELENYAWDRTNSDIQAHIVGTKKSNGIGLHDMSGNVWEWVEDCWHPNYKGAPNDGRAWHEENGGVCARRVNRGGSWDNGPAGLRTSDRYWNNAVNRTNNTGFRLAQDTD